LRSRDLRARCPLLEGGIPLLRSLDIVKNVVNNVVLRNAIETVATAFTKDYSVAEPLKKAAFSAAAHPHDRRR
jgi:type II secretory pathway component PulF